MTEIYAVAVHTCAVTLHAHAGTVTIVSHRPRFCRQTFELDSGDPSETFALLLRGRAEILKRSSLIKRNSADFGVIGGLSAVITVITVTFAIER